MSDNQFGNGPAQPNQPGQYPQSQYPQGQGQYPQQQVPPQGSAPQGFGPQGPGGPTGQRPMAPQAPAGNSGNKTILMVVIGLVIMAVIGGGIALVNRRGAVATPDPAPPSAPATTPAPVPTTPAPVPTTPAPVPTTPAPVPTTPAPVPPSAGASTPATQPPAGSGYELGFGIVLNAPAGWEVVEQELGYVVIENPQGQALAFETFTSDGTAAEAMVTSYLDRQAGRMTQTDLRPAKVVELHPDIDVAQGAIAGMFTGSSGSYPLAIVTLISVRTADKATVATTAFYDPTVTEATDLQAVYNQVTLDLLKQQVAR